MRLSRSKRKRGRESYAGGESVSNWYTYVRVLPARGIMRERAHDHGKQEESVKFINLRGATVVEKKCACGEI